MEDYLPVSENLVKSAKSFWAPRYGRELSDEEAREIIKNVLTFFEVLVETDAKERSCEDVIGSATEG